MWINGNPGYLPGLNLFGDVLPDMVGAQVGYFGDPTHANPVVGEPYSAHLVVGVRNPPIGRIEAIRTGIFLPAGTGFYSTPNAPMFICNRQNRITGQVVDSTNDPGAVCPVTSPGMLPNGAFDLNIRSLPQDNLFEIWFNLISDAPLQRGEQIIGYVDARDYGNIYCNIPVRVFPPAEPPVRSGRLRVRTAPAWIDIVGSPIAFTVITEDSGNGEPIQGIATIRNFSESGVEEVVDVPTNTVTVMTFHLKYDSPIADVIVPGGGVNCLGYEQDPNATIPFRFYGGF